MDLIRKKETTWLVIILFILMLSVFSYEKYIYTSYYSVIQKILAGICFVSFVLIITFDKNANREFVKGIKKNKTLNCLCILMLLSTAINTMFSDAMTLMDSLASLLIIINIYFFFMIVPYVLDEINLEKFRKIFTYIITILGVITIIIGVKDSFLWYKLIEYRSAGIYFDPNYMALILAATVALNINNKDPKMIVCTIINCLAVVYTGSRGGILSLIGSVLLTFVLTIKKPMGKKILIMLALFIGALCVILYLNSINFFRLKQGSNGRFEMIAYGLEITAKKPLVGYGYGTVSGALKEAGFLNSSTHNALADFAISFGFPALIAYGLLILKSILNAIKNKKNTGVICATICLAINMNTIVYIIGGVGAGSMLFTILLGICGAKSYGGSNEENKYSSSGI